MTATAQAGILLFGPQTTAPLMTTPASVWFAHRALGVDLAVIDDQRIGPPEVGGRPLPTLPYKAGYMVAGGATFHPRLQNSFGWLLYGTMGAMNYQNAGGPFKAINQDGLMTERDSSTGPFTFGTGTGWGALPAAGAKLAVTIVKADSTPWPASFSVSIAGTAAPAGPESFNFVTGLSTTQREIRTTINAAAPPALTNAIETIIGVDVFTVVTTITVTGGNSSYRIMVGWEDPTVAVGNIAYQHDFSLSSTDPTFVPWMSFRKYIPTGSVANTDLGETYIGCKVIGNTIVLPNDGLISSRVDVVGRDFSMVQQPWQAGAGYWGASQPTFESYDSVPIGTVIQGYLKIPYFDGADLPIVGAQIGWVNQPLDQRMERVYGDPMLNDVTVVGRQMTFDLTVKWNNPDLYRAVLSNSKTGTVWNSTPFTTRLDVLTQTPGYITGSTVPYSLRIQAQKVMLAMRGGIQLAAGQAVMMRFTGTALDVGGEYVRISLVNAQNKYDIAAVD